MEPLSRKGAVARYGSTFGLVHVFKLEGSVYAALFPRMIVSLAILGAIKTVKSQTAFLELKRDLLRFDLNFEHCSQ